MLVQLWFCKSSASKLCFAHTFFCKSNAEDVILSHIIPQVLFVADVVRNNSSVLTNQMACSTGLSPCRHFSKLRLRMLFCPSLFLLQTCLKRLGHPISFVHFCCIGCFRKLAFLNWFSKRSYCVQLLLDHACFDSHVTFLLVRF